MRGANLKDLGVDALLTLRTDVEKALTERSRHLQRKLALLGGEVGKRRGRPPGRAGRVSAMKGRKVAPKYRGPGGETWAGRGATPRWLAALLKEGHSLEEFLIGSGRSKKATALQRNPSQRRAARLLQGNAAERSAPRKKYPK